MVTLCHILSTGFLIQNPKGAFTQSVLRARLGHLTSNILSK